MLLTAALIVRDEAEHLGDCLDALHDLVDEIVVVDTGSVDTTPEIALSHGAIVDHFPWQNDFSAARNRSLDLAHGAWILSIDADERVRVADPNEARNAIGRAHDTVAFRVRFTPRVGWTSYRELRLWRNHPDIRFVKTKHENIVPGIKDVAERTGATIDPFDLMTIEHLGYEGDQSGKRQRDEPLLRAAIAETPDHSFLYDHLARVYEGADNSALAIATWKQGIEVARARDASSPDDRLVYLGLLSHLLAMEQVDDEFGVLVTETTQRFGGLPTVELAAARYEFATGHPRDAIRRLEALLATDLDSVVELGAAFDQRVFGEWAWDLLGLCRLQLGDDRGAVEAFAQAEEAAPAVDAYGVRRRLAEARVSTPT